MERITMAGMARGSALPQALAGGLLALVVAAGAIWYLNRDTGTVSVTPDPVTRQEPPRQTTAPRTDPDPGLSGGVLPDGGELPTAISESGDTLYMAGDPRAPIPEPVVVAPRDNGAPGFTYTVPRPTDPEWPDYLEQLNSDRWVRQNRPGAVIYYDPEWQADIRGHRDVPRNDLQLMNAAQSVEELIKMIFVALAENDFDGLNYLRTTRDEFQLLIWPEQPTSRPFLRLVPDEAWTLQFGTMNKGAQEGMKHYGGQNWDLVDFKIGKIAEFVNYRLLLDIVITAENIDTGEVVEMDWVNGIVECRGKYKVYLYKD